eukprot:NODE_8178_length_296_cov_40.137652_g7438_i0.p3 GENE.NODE_8178_length_296_cov_40.137652_g7438_i0~~NODE_8178_length_296_cov_40.137652_g7438_i0.p3  ORF type:complete len:59 (+),score=4.31 NODE_8178_length_296_cov_40.137652_g7438_i0:88-264(+)
MEQICSGCRCDKGAQHCPSSEQWCGGFSHATPTLHEIACSKEWEQTKDIALGIISRIY